MISESDVHGLLPMEECVEIMAEALRTLGQGDAVLPLRTMVWLPDRSGLLGLMPGYLGSPRAFGLKIVTVKPSSLDGGREAERPHRTHQGVVALFDPDTGSLLAFIDASSITAIRTAAISAVATRTLAREDAGDLAILGSGVQAESHLRAMQAVRRIRRVRVWSRDPERARRFADAMGMSENTRGSQGGPSNPEMGRSPTHLANASSERGIHQPRPGEVRSGEAPSEEAGPGSALRDRHECPAIEAVASARAAVEGADIICTTTASLEPVLEGAWLSPGAHINAVGACFPSARELDTPAVLRSRLYVDRRESALHEAGDFLIPKKEGALGDEHIVGELGDVLLGRIPGRQRSGEITLFKSLGIAIEDLAAASHIYRKAIATGAGTAVPF